MLHNPELFQRDVSAVLRREAKSLLGLREPSYTLRVVMDRFFDCLTLEELPSKYVLTDFTSEDGVMDYCGAAQSCEVYGGLFYRHIRSHKFLNTQDFDSLLASMYGFSESPVLRSLSPQAPDLLRSYRRTADFMFQQGSLPQIFSVK